MPDQANHRVEVHDVFHASTGTMRLDYPLVDLDSAIEVAKVLKNQGGDVCDFARLKELVVSSSLDGDNSREIEAAEVFGLIARRDDLVFLTPLGRSVVVPAEAAAARVEAFLRVPLYAHFYERYRDALLPNVREMDHELGRLGIPVEDWETIRITFHRSAMVAGFFSLGSHRLVKPTLRGAAPARPLSVPVPSLRPSGIRATLAPVRPARTTPHPMLQALISSLPTPGSVWPLEQRRKWLESAVGNFDILYEGTEVDSGSLRISIDR